jgi:MFS family permease
VSLQTDILSTAAIPALLLMGVGQSSTILSVTVLLGQESPEGLRGSTFGMQSLFGAIGILLISVLGGRLFDNVGPYAPFMAIAIANGLVFIAAFVVKLGEGKQSKEAAA